MKLKYHTDSIATNITHNTHLFFLYVNIVTITIIFTNYTLSNPNGKVGLEDVW
jgi:hypothetical protein